MIGSAGPMISQAAAKTVIRVTTPTTVSSVVGSPARRISGWYSTHW